MKINKDLFIDSKEEEIIKELLWEEKITKEEIEKILIKRKKLPKEEWKRIEQILIKDKKISLKDYSKILKKITCEIKTKEFNQVLGLEEGSKFKNYKILKEIAKGGMGIIYKVKDEKFDKILALKVLLTGKSADEKEKLRFKREIKILEKLNNPNIIKIYDSGEWKGFYYYTMEYIEGYTLKDLIKKESMRKLIKILIKSLHALDYLHRKGIIHRDLKPSNILIDKNLEPYITDFGLSKIQEGEKSLTGSDTILGTPYYMAPEQIERKKKIDHRTDIYAMGIILYEILTKRKPFDGKSVLEIYNNILKKSPKPPSKIASRISKKLEKICLKALEKKKEKRYFSALEFAAELESYIISKNYKIKEKIYKDSREKIKKVGVIVIVIAAISILIIFFLNNNNNKYKKKSTPKILKISNKIKKKISNKKISNKIINEKKRERLNNLNKEDNIISFIRDYRIVKNQYEKRLIEIYSKLNECKNKKDLIESKKLIEGFTNFLEERLKYLNRVLNIRDKKVFPKFLEKEAKKIDIYRDTIEMKIKLLKLEKELKFYKKNEKIQNKILKYIKKIVKEYLQVDFFIITALKFIESVDNKFFFINKDREIIDIRTNLYITLDKLYVGLYFFYNLLKNKEKINLKEETIFYIKKKIKYIKRKIKEREGENLVRKLMGYLSYIRASKIDIEDKMTKNAIEKAVQISKYEIQGLYLPIISIKILYLLKKGLINKAYKVWYKSKNYISNLENIKIKVPLISLYYKSPKNRLFWPEFKFVYCLILFFKKDRDIIKNFPKWRKLLVYPLGGMDFVKSFIEEWYNKIEFSGEITKKWRERLSKTAVIIIDIMANRAIVKYNYTDIKKVYKDFANFLCLENLTYHLIVWKLGSTLRGLGYYKKGIYYLTKANLLAPTFSEPIFVKGLTYLKLENKEKALECFYFCALYPCKWPEEWYYEALNYIKMLNNK